MIRFSTPWFRGGGVHKNGLWDGLVGQDLHWSFPDPALAMSGVRCWHQKRELFFEPWQWRRLACLIPIPPGLYPTPPLQAADLGRRGAGDAGTAPIALCFDYSYWGWRIILTEAVLSLRHPSHITLHHGAVVIPNATVRVAHSFEVIT